MSGEVFAQIGTIIISLISIIVTAVIIPFIRSKTTVAQHTQLGALVKVAVFAAEQMFAGAGKGQEKKEYVLDYLNRAGIKIASEQLDALIEAAVYEINKIK